MNFVCGIHRKSCVTNELSSTWAMGLVDMSGLSSIIGLWSSARRIRRASSNSFHPG